VLVVRGWDLLKCVPRFALVLLVRSTGHGTRRGGAAMRVERWLGFARWVLEIQWAPTIYRATSPSHAGNELQLHCVSDLGIESNFLRLSVIRLMGKTSFETLVLSAW
jgi:hypothetical protein